MSKESALQEANTAYSIKEIAKKASLGETYMCIYLKDQQSGQIKAFYIKNDDFNLLSDEEIRQTTFYKMLVSRLLNGNTQINTKISTLGFKQKAGTLENKNEQNLVDYISNKVQTANDVFFWLNNRTDNLLHPDSEIQQTAMKHYVLMDKIFTLLREDCPNLIPNYEISGHSLGTHFLTYFLDFCNHDDHRATHLLDSASKIEINLQSIPTFKKLGVNWIKRPKEMAQKMFEVISNERILKHIRDGRVSFKFDVNSSTYHTPKGTLEYLHELFNLIPNSNKLNANDKAYLINSLQQATINFKQDAYPRLRYWAQKNGRFDEEHKFLQNFNIPEFDEMQKKADEQDRKKLQNTTYFPEIATGLLSVSGTTLGILGTTGTLSINKKISIAIIAICTIALIIAITHGIYKRSINNKIKSSLKEQQEINTNNGQIK